MPAIARDHKHGNEAIPAALSLTSLTTTSVTVSGVDGLRYKAIAARAFNVGTISLTDGDNILLTCDSESFDTSAFHSTSANTGRMTAPYTAKYALWAQAVVSGEATAIDSSRRLQLRLNANGSGSGGTALVDLRVGNPALTAAYPLAVSCLAALTAGDYFEAFVIQNSGETLDASDIALGIAYLGD